MTPRKPFLKRSLIYGAVADTHEGRHLVDCMDRPHFSASRSGGTPWEANLEIDRNLATIYLLGVTLGDDLLWDQ